MAAVREAHAKVEELMVSFDSPCLLLFTALPNGRAVNKITITTKSHNLKDDI